MFEFEWSQSMIDVMVFRTTPSGLAYVAGAPPPHGSPCHLAISLIRCRATFGAACLSARSHRAIRPYPISHWEARLPQN